MKNLIVAGLLLFLAACSAPLKTVDAVQAPAPILPTKPRPMVMIDFDFYVFEYEGEMWIALTPKGYEALSLDMAEIERYIKQLELNNEVLRAIIIPPSEEDS